MVQSGGFEGGEVEKANRRSEGRKTMGAERTNQIMSALAAVGFLNINFYLLLCVAARVELQLCSSKVDSPLIKHL